MNGQCPYCHEHSGHDAMLPPPTYATAVRRRRDGEFDGGERRHSRDNVYDTKSQLKRELVQFCSNTTIRGIPRIVKARTDRLRWLWLSSVFLLFAGCFGCMVFLTKQYLEYNVIHPPRVLRDTSSPFPALTVCNLRPLSKSGKKFLIKQKLRHPRSYASSVNRYGKKEFFDRYNKTIYFKLTAFMSLGGYLESLPNYIRESKYEMLGHVLKNLVIHCSVLFLDNGTSTRVTKMCDDVGTWHHIVHAAFLNCYTYNLTPKYRGTTKSIEMFLYLNEDLNATTCVDCFSQDAKTQQSGAAIHIHNAETYPNLNQELINLMPGTLTEIKLKSYQNIQKEPPHGRCSPKTPKHISLGNHTYVYSEYACRLATIQEEINERCKCSAIEYPMENFTLPYCSELPHFIYTNSCHISTNPMGANFTPVVHERCRNDVNLALHRLMCKINVTEKYEKDVVPSCTLHCAFYSYDSDRSTSIWPSKAFQTTWLKTRIGRKIVNNPEMYPYRQAMTYMAEGKHDKAWHVLQTTSVVEKNLVGVFVNRPNFNVNKVEEKEVLSLTSFLSQAGGLLSIFIGLTFISVVEVSEFILHCVNTVLSRKRDNGGRSTNMLDVDGQGSRSLTGNYPSYEIGQPGFRSFACSHRNDTHILECQHCALHRGVEASV